MPDQQYIEIKMKRRSLIGILFRTPGLFIWHYTNFRKHKVSILLSIRTAYALSMVVFEVAKKRYEITPDDIDLELGKEDNGSAYT